MTQDIRAKLVEAMAEAIRLPDNKHNREKIEATLTALLAALEAAGWQMVPKVATEEMYFQPLGGASPSEVWRLMCSAAPALGEKP